MEREMMRREELATKAVAYRQKLKVRVVDIMN